MLPLPAEIMEKILKEVDGTCLINARQIDDDWKRIVNYLTRKTRIWEWCCKEEIPFNELVEYTQHYNGDDQEKWLKIYINWYSWENPTRIIFDISLIAVYAPRISCIAVSAHFIAVGSMDGRLRIFTTELKPLFAARILAVKLESLDFIESVRTEDNTNLVLIISFHRGLQLFWFDGVSTGHVNLLDIKTHSVHKKYVCYEKFIGRIYISKVIDVGGIKEFEVVGFTRLYGQFNVSCMKLWEDVCTILTMEQVKVLQYNTGNTLEEFTLKSSLSFNNQDRLNIQILRDNLIINLSRESDRAKYCIEVFIIEKNGKYSKSQFSVWEIFNCHITCIYLYGNTLIFGTDVGTVYMYHVSNWKNLNIREYDHKFIIGRHPIVSMDVKEYQHERLFYISSRFDIHVLRGYLPNIYKN